MPIAVPSPMEPKIFGIVMNISDGPACRLSAALSPEKANTAGIIMSPARMAMPVSNSSTSDVDFSMLTSFSI